MAASTGCSCTSEQGLSTPVVYGRLDALREEEGMLADDPPMSLDVPIPVLQALRSGDPALLAESLLNDLQAAAVFERPDLDATIQDGIRAGALHGIVSGSGPTVALLCADPESAQDVQSVLQRSGRRGIACARPGAGCAHHPLTSNGSKGVEAGRPLSGCPVPQPIPERVLTTRDVVVCLTSWFRAPDASPCSPSYASETSAIFLVPQMGDKEIC